MTKLSLALLVVPALLANPPVFGNEPVPEPSRPLTLRIYDHVEIAPDTLHRAQKQTSRIFRQFGIETAWLGCPTSPEQLTTNGACRAPLGPTDLVVKILPESMSKKYGLPKGVFGFALPTNKGRFGRTVNVFYGRVFDMAYYGPVGGGFETAQAVILGHVLAHEIGHVFLGPGSHSEKGIMGFPWGRRQLVDASRARLRFSVGQIKKIVRRFDDLLAEAAR